MILVLSFSEGDGYTYSCNVVLPFEAESPEQALVDLEKLIIETNEQSKIDWKTDFEFCGLKLSSGLFYETSGFRDDRTSRLYLPDIYTIEEWYNSEHPG